MMREVAILGSLVVLGSAGLVWWTLGQAQNPVAIRQQRDVVFATVAGESLCLDMAQPSSGTGPFPAVVCIHGGGWTAGHRRQMARTIEVLARRGFVAVTIDYRLAPRHAFPACLEDCCTAIRWLRSQAERLSIDPKRLGVVGLSAGGHLACLTALHEPGLVQAAASFAGPTDLTDEALWVEPTLSRNLRPLLGGLPRDKMDLCRKASPLHARMEQPPPFLLVHGVADPVVPLAQVKAFAARLHEAGGAVRLLPLERAGHTWQGDDLMRSIDVLLTFLDETLHP
jgi:acetyl esterase/lipase